ncbi:T9SS type B sorting domain-containing protein [Flavobacterium sp.]|uniref:T9SS type B sorting domain-containing protein n=2 Tax=Flavobacterium sp. TaxID=239 RepID=UPI0040480D3E
MVKKIIFAFLLFPLFLFSQTFTNSVVEPAGSWNASLTKTITVSGLPILQNGVFELNQVNLHLGDDANTRNYSSYRIVLQKGALVIELVATNGLPNSIIRQIDTKFRYNNVLKRLFEHGGTTQPFHIGYYRSQDDFSAFNGIDPNGDWTITITESSVSSGGKFNKIDLVFGVPLSINSQISTTTYDSCSSPLCVSSNEITIATNDGFTPQVSDMFNGNTTGCSWNAAQNNSSWFRFTATQSSAKITISGISGNIQILGISPGSDNNICTPADNVVITGGCPDDVLNDSYFSPQYLNGSTRNNQVNLSGLVTGQEYYFIVDGTGGAISPFYIEIEGANQSCNCFVDTPVVNTTPASCSSNSISTIFNYDALLNYTFSPLGPTIGVGGVISNMNTGVNYTLIASNGSCSSTSSASFSYFDQLVVQPEPTINSVAASCSSAGSSTISNYDASNTYTFSPVGPTVGAAGVISGMTVGISYTVTATNGSCTSLASISFSNAAQLSTPTVPTITSVAASCSSAGSSTISNYDASNTYAFTPAGPIVGAGGVISVMTIGTSYTVTATNGGCTSLASLSFSNAAQLSTPAVPTITSVAASCLSAGSSTISNYDVSNTYTFTPAGPIVGAGGVISSMTIGTSYTVIAANGGCSSLASVNFSNSAQLPPLQGTISGTNNSTCSVSPICVPTGTNVVINEVMHWPSGGQGLIGTGREYIELYNPTCSPIDISCFIIGTRSAPDSNPTGPLQTGGSIIIPSGTILQPKSHYVIGTSSTSSNLLSVDFKTDLNLSNYCSTGNFVMPNGDGWLALYNSSGTAIDALYWTVGVNQSTKITTPDDDFNDRPCIPSSVGSCTTTGITLLSANEIYIFNPILMNYVGISTPNPLAPTNLTFSRIPDGGVWQGQTVGTIDTNNCNNGVCDTNAVSSCDGTATVTPINGIGPFNYLWNTAAGNQITQTATGLCAGDYSVIVTDTANGCQQTFNVTISNNPLNTPTINSVTATCSSDGSSIISNYDASNTYVFTPAGPIVGAAGVITGMIVGTSYSVIATNGSCISLASASFSNAAQLSTPTVPTITSVAASCSSAGSSTISNYDASNTYTFTPAGPIVGAGGVISVMTIGTSYTVTATNGGCTSLASLSFSIAAQLSTPVVPTITSVAASCLSAGSSTISNYDVSNTYTFSPAGPSVGATGVISGMTVGTIYTVTATNGGCTSLSSVSFSNAAQLESPIVSITHGCNGISYELSAIVESGVATYEWFNSSLVSLGSTPTISITNPDTYEVRVSLNGCSVSDFVTIDDAFCMIPKGISPNNDGDNDSWDLSNLNVEKAQIFNRYGVEVYSKNNYTDEWDGRTDSGEELPTATYYYVLTFSNGTVKTGWVYLNRVN